MPTILWGASDIARHRGVTRAAINQALTKHNPPPPDFTRTNGDSLWRPETIVPWADKLPTRGTYPRKGKA